MPLRFSTALKNNQAGRTPAIAATTIASTGTDTLSLTAGNLLTEGFIPGDVIELVDQHADNKFMTINVIATDGASCTVVETITNNAGDGDETIVLANGKDMMRALKYGVIDLFSESQPSEGDAVENGTKLIRLTVSSLAVVAGIKTNGIQFDVAVDGKISIKAGDVISGVGLVAGTAEWGRFYSNALITGVDAVAKAIRLDGDCGVSNAAFILSDVKIKVGQTTTCDQFDLTQRSSRYEA